MWIFVELQMCESNGGLLRKGFVIIEWCGLMGPKPDRRVDCPHKLEEKSGLLWTQTIIGWRSWATT